MSAKLKKTAAPAASKKPEAKKAAPAAKKAEPKKAEAKKADGKKGDAKKSDAKKNDEEADLRATAVSEEGDAEDMEDDEAGSGGGGGNAAALAAAAGSGDSSASFKNFRHHPDMENFYRFIYENDLRIEALAIIDQVMADKLAKKAAKPAKG